MRDVIGIYGDDTAILERLREIFADRIARNVVEELCYFLLLNFNGLETIAKGRRLSDIEEDTGARWNREARLILNECIQRRRRSEQRAEN